MAWLRSAAGEPLGHADLRQAILAGAHQGGRVRLSAEVRGTWDAGFYLRIVDSYRSQSPEDHQHTAPPASGGPLR
ncbi:hypothetical protein [Microbispora sp. NPDC049125]|uniref:hypothetical protein n=1 Tax=Microbispora sp. NPDC049125 TaxID=3154929 RepID=UPI00346720CF